MMLSESQSFALRQPGPSRIVLQLGILAGWPLPSSCDPTPDAGASEGLDNAVAEALPKNPAAVLEMLGADRAKQFAVQRICSFETFIEVPTPTLRRHVLAVMRAVKGVKEARLRQARNSCLSALDANLRILRAR